MAWNKNGKGRQRYKGVVLAKRVLSLPDDCDTTCVRKRLELSNPTIAAWLANEYFQRSGVAVKFGERWKWNSWRLYLWLLAVGTLKLPKKCPVITENPHIPNNRTFEAIEIKTKTDARDVLGIPEDWTLTAQE